MNMGVRREKQMLLPFKIWPSVVFIDTKRDEILVSIDYDTSIFYMFSSICVEKKKGN